MDFGSEYIYFNEPSDDELEEDTPAERLTTDANRFGASADTIPQLRQPIQAASSGRRLISQPSDAENQPVVATSHGAEPTRILKADPNVIKFKVAHALVKPNLTSRDIPKCVACPAVLSQISITNTTSSPTGLVWTCDFCSTRNTFAPSYVPPPEDVTYELTAPQNGQAVVQDVANTRDDAHYVVFAIDISTSMGETAKEVTTVSEFGQRHQYITRLDALKAAVERQIKDLFEKSPNVKVGILTFSDKIHWIGDGTTEKQTIWTSDMKMSDVEKMKDWGAQVPALRTISETHPTLVNVLRGLNVEGRTALGPALLGSIAIASRMRGSMVVICTDGMANVGYGNISALHSYSDPESIGHVHSVYTEFGSYAQEKGVTVSVISITGTDCKLVYLGKTAQISGGHVDTVDPAKITDGFISVIDNRTLATDVKLTICLHQSMFLVASPGQPSHREFILGNVNRDTSVMQKLGVKGAQYMSQQQGMDLQPQIQTEIGNPPADLPFQIQIEFTLHGGGVFKRVTSERRRATTSRVMAEGNMDLSVMSAFARMQVSEAALEGNVEMAENRVVEARRLAWRSGNVESGLITFDSPAAVADCAPLTSDSIGGTPHPPSHATPAAASVTATKFSGQSINEYLADVDDLAKTIREMKEQAAKFQREQQARSFARSQISTDCGYLVADSYPAAAAASSDYSGSSRLTRDSGAYPSAVPDYAPSAVADCIPSAVADSAPRAQKRSLGGQAVQNLQQQQMMSDQMAQKFFSNFSQK